MATHENERPNWLTCPTFRNDRRISWTNTCHSVSGRQALSSGQPLAQRAALDVGHDILKEPTRLAGIVHGEDVRVGESRHDLDFVEEPLDADDRGEAGEQHLERDLTLMPGVVGQIHAGHAAAAEQAAELEPPGERGLEIGGEVR